MNKVAKILVVVVLVLGVVGVWTAKNKSSVSDVPVSNLNEMVNNEEALMQEEEQEDTNEIVPDEIVENEMVEAVSVKDKIEKVPLKIEENPKLKQEILKDKSDEKDIVHENKQEEQLVEKPDNQETIVEEVNVENVASEVVTPDLVAAEFNLQKLKEYKLPIMIEFGASWCTWCRWMEPTLEELNKEYAGKVVIQSVDVERFYNEVKDFDVSLLPTIYFFDAEGNVFETRVGAMTRENILSVFERMGVKND